MNGCQHCGKQHPPGAPVCPLTGESMSLPGLMGTRLDRYEIQQLLGAGGFGTVYRAKHVHTDAIVALKVLKKQLSMDAQMVERFLREAKAAAAVGSDHIVRVLDAGNAADGTAFLAMEYLAGWDLKELATREGPLSAMRLALLTVQVLDGLGAAHAKGIVHRDMKPANVFVLRKQDDRGFERDFIKLLDFGISKMHADGAQAGLTMTGVAMGTPSYMAPEQFFDARNVDGRADLYSIAVMLYELLAGRLPFDAQSYAELIVKVRTEQPPFLQQVAPAVPMALAQVVMVGLAREKEQRWPNALEFGNALRGSMGLPGKGQTPAFAAVTPQPAVQPPGPVVARAPGPDTPSMLLGKTATPTPAIRPAAQQTPQTPQTPRALSQPNVVASPSLMQDANQLGNAPGSTPAPMFAPQVQAPQPPMQLQP